MGRLVTPVLHVVQRVVTRHLLAGVQLKADEGHGGAVTLIQRFGSAANLNVHLHCLVLDGVYRCDPVGAPIFVEAGAPTDDELHALLQTVITRLMKMLTRRGVLIEDMGQTYLAEPDDNGEETRTLRPLQAAAITYRIAFGPRAGRKVLTLRGAMPRETTARQPLCADIDGQPVGLYRRLALGRHKAPYGPLCLASPGTRPCGSMHTTASGWSNCAATSPGRPYLTSGFSSTPPGRWS